MYVLSLQLKTYAFWRLVLVFASEFSFETNTSFVLMFIVFVDTPIEEEHVYN